MPTNSSFPSSDDRDLLKNIRTRVLEETGKSFTLDEIAGLFGIDSTRAQRCLDWLSDLEREYELNPEFRGVRKVLLDQGIRFEALADNPDVRRDYDYRATNDGGRDLCPKNMFYYMWSWINMVEAKCEALGVKHPKIALITRDCRYYPEEIIEAAKRTAMLRGYEVVYAFAQDTSPSCISSFSHAVRLVRPALAVFITASHVSRPLENIVVGAKVSFVGAKGDLESLSTRDIKEVTPKHIQAAQGSLELNKLIRPTNAYREIDVGPSHTRLASAAVLASLGYLPDTTLYSLSLQLKNSRDIDELLRKLVPEAGPRPLEGLTVAIEGAHTTSGPLADKAFRAVGAKTILLRGNIKELKGPHDADPSILANLASLFEVMTREQANMGIAFDLDGDRGAIVLPTQSGNFFVLAPDKLGQVLIPFLMEDGGYSRAPKPLYVRDCFSTDAVLDQCLRSQVTLETTDAGYVYLKKRLADREKDGYQAISMGEASGHAWLDFTGPFENPVVLSMLFASMCVKRSTAAGLRSANQAISPLALEKVFNELAIPYRKAVRFQPLFAPALLEEVSKESRNDTGWKPGSNRPVPQKMINLCRSASIAKLKDFFTEGRAFSTPLGKLEVTRFECNWDEQEEIFRYGKIYFSLNSEWIGSFVSRGSSNDPTAAQVWEVKEFDVETWKGVRLPEDVVMNRFDLVGGIVLQQCEELGILSLEDRAPAVNMAGILESYKRFLALKG